MPDGRSPDAELIARCQAGDRKAFDALVERYRGVVHALALRHLGDAELAADVAQEALLAAYSSLSSLREPARFAAWLRAITGNLCADKIAGATRERRRLTGLVAGTEPDPAQELQRGEVERTVREQVQRLSSANRMAVTLFYFDGLSCREVADFYGVSVSAVKSRLHAARRALQGGNAQMGNAKEPWAGQPAAWIGYSGEMNFAALFGRGRDLRDFYSALYPARRQDDLQFWERWAGVGVPHETLRLWEDARVVTVEDGEVVGQVPIYTEADHELFAAWHARASQAMLKRLGERPDAIRDLQADFRAISDDEGSLRFITVIGRLIAGGVSAVLEERLVETSHDWGGLGHAYVYGRQPGLPCTGGFSLHSRHSEASRASFSTFQDNDGRFAGQDALDEQGYELVVSLLARLARTGLATDGAPDAHGEGEEVRLAGAMADKLLAARWIEKREGQSLLALPWLPWSANEDARRLMPLAEDLCEPIVQTAHELRALASRSSFARCRFTDTAYLLTSITIGFVTVDLMRRGLVLPYDEVLQPGRGAWMYVG